MDSGIRFQELANAAPVLIWRVGTDGVFNWLNRTWLEFRSRAIADEVGQPWGHGIHPAEIDSCRKQFETAFDARAGFLLDYRLRRHDGKYRWMADQGRPFFLSDGTFAGYLGTCLDISDQKEAELRARTALADARRALRQRDILLGEVHHRVKNNLQVILSLLSLRTRSVADPATRDELQSLARRIQAMGHVQAEIHGEADVTSIVLVDFLRRLARPLAVLHGCDDVDVAVEGPGAAIEASTAGIIGFIIAELISNCFCHAFSDGPGRVHVAVSGGDGDAIEIEVSDSGPGFRMADAEHKGSVGLHIARSLARQGDVELTHTGGLGARWRLRLPGPANRATDA
ncbi:MAG: PAS domain-containing protein [Burkholderiales bacterium]|nr:PAS domain-containing protein [Burkholderiales bacterium]